MDKFIVFTDLDATLLDHEDYSYESAAPALKALKEQHIPLILNSSKTLSEISALKAEMGNDYPCVAENGSVIDWSGEKDGIEILGADIEDILEVLKPLKGKFKFRGFSDYTLTELAQEINMPEELTALAKLRLGSEPVKWLDDPDMMSEFERSVSEAGLQVLRGGRFFHIMGKADKSSALRKIKKHFQEKYGEVTSIALGDSPNDRLMLETADIGILIPNPHSAVWQGSERLKKASQPGSAGWNEQILKILNKTGK